jgi:hypothetical protein
VHWRQVCCLPSRWQQARWQQARWQQVRWQQVRWQQVRWQQVRWRPRTGNTAAPTPGSRRLRPGTVTLASRAGVAR